MNGEKNEWKSKVVQGIDFRDINDNFSEYKTSLIALNPLQFVQKHGRFAIPIECLPELLHQYYIWQSLKLTKKVGVYNPRLFLREQGLIVKLNSEAKK